jgi:hypothetical protein
MARANGTAAPVPWSKEPTKEQWIAWWATWLGRTLDAFDFTIGMARRPRGAGWPARASGNLSGRSQLPLFV